MLFSLIKGTNTLISKGMSNIYLEVDIEKNWRFQKFDFSKFKVFASKSIFGEF